MKWWQWTTIPLTMLLVGGAVAWLMPPAMAAVKESAWQCVVMFGFMIVPPLLIATVMIAVDRQGQNPVNLEYPQQKADKDVRDC